MRAALAVLLAGILLVAGAGCAATRNTHSSFFRPADYYSSEGGYRPWNDVNTGGLPPLSFWPYGCGPYAYGSNWDSPTVRLPPP